MKVLFLTPRFYPDLGGVEKHVFEITRQLLKKNISVSIITEQSQTESNNINSIYHSPDPSDNLMKALKQPGMSAKTNKQLSRKIAVYRFNFGSPGKLKKFRIWGELWRSRKLMQQADVIHCHDVFFWYLPFRILYPKKKVFTTFHGYETVYPPQLKAKAIRKISEHLSNGNVCVGNYIEKWYGTKADIITYGGVRKIQNSKVKTPHSAKASRDKQNHNSKIKILFVGRISHDNGVEKYIEILKELKKRNVNFDFQAVGDGVLRKAFEQFGTVHGFVENTDQYVQKAEVIFASSYLSILEALVYKKLVISVYDNPLKRDYLEMTLFKNHIIIADEPFVAVDSILDFRNNKEEIKNKILKGWEWARSQTWEKLTDKYINLWGTV